ncbi:uncharacterized protein EV422DRAFT_506364 [Fimicolochytrium jonesii]|uniref:uncharacterized protein n=1 Tax=Fimicolochytrium jonesii TaxID=1396493 RepID=UPI0022FEE890|nr:uncharacterized protein EV422DRAFT_506364 [Fimicolochytrium jonesii]KAI8821161.1 hypothetical protein EV422DRAFT_506364 [Fimicolochytrium jonesii]
MSRPQGYHLALSSYTYAKLQQQLREQGHHHPDLEPNQYQNQAQQPPSHILVQHRISSSGVRRPCSSLGDLFTGSCSLPPRRVLEETSLPRSTGSKIPTPSSALITPPVSNPDLTKEATLIDPHHQLPSPPSTLNRNFSALGLKTESSSRTVAIVNASTPKVLTTDADDIPATAATLHVIVPTVSSMLSSCVFTAVAQLASASSPTQPSSASTSTLPTKMHIHGAATPPLHTQSLTSLASSSTSTPSSAVNTPPLRAKRHSSVSAQLATPPPHLWWPFLPPNTVVASVDYFDFLVPPSVLARSASAGVETGVLELDV